MAGTTSATQRESHVLAASLAGSQKCLTNTLIIIGKGGLWRGLAVLCAALLTCAGLVAPYMDPQVLATPLLAVGAALVFFAGSRSLPAQLNQSQNVKSAMPSPSSPPAPHANAQRVRQSQTMLTELQAESRIVAPADAAPWRHLTHRMSHELRTPLNAVIGFSELMSAEVFGPLGASQYHDYARSIHSSGRVLLKSAEDALAITNLLTRPAARGRESTAGVRTAIDDMLAFHHAEMQMLNLDLEIEGTGALEVMGEAQTLRQILINLMSEAIENAAPGSDAAVRCSANADEVFMTLNTGGTRRKSAAGEESFNMVLARTLVQLSQGRLIEYSDENNWSATAVFPRASQRDFFAAQQDIQVF